MNKHNALLAALDNVYGNEGENISTFKPVNKYYSQETGEMVTTIIYKTKKQGEVIIKNNKPDITNKNNGLLNSILQPKKS